MIDFIKTHFKKPNNDLIQIIITHALVFVGLLFFKAACVLSGYSAFYYTLYDRLVLPTSWSNFVNQPWSLLTYFWLREGFFANIWSLVVLYSFGQLVAIRWSTKHSVRIYLLGNIIGGGLLLLLCNYSTFFSSNSPYLIGNTGGIYAVMAATAVPMPSYFGYLFTPEIVPIRYLVAFLLLYAVYELSGANPASGIVQLGGAIVGYLYVRCVMQRHFKRATPDASRPAARRKPTRKTIHKLAKQDIVDAEDATHVDQKTIDAILDKVADFGYGSLTKPERQQLFKAGK
ncbi:MAG: rhomboid family intramembrane serine protease [Bacteroidota bacterium]